ncbi:MAG: asparagine synthase C-terminal domain-containing protein [Candidatus Anstonellaceae archaeon]
MIYMKKLSSLVIKKLVLLLLSCIKKVSKLKPAIAFSGGLDSTTLAVCAKKFYKPILITLAADNQSQDLFYAKKISKELSLPLKICFLNKKKILQVYKKIWKIKTGTLIDMEIMISVFFICKKAQELGCNAVIFGSGAEELFVGYKKYFIALEEGKNLEQLLNMELETLPKRDILRIKKVANLFKIKAIFPFLDKTFVRQVKSIPLNYHINPHLSKPVLRKIAKILQVPYLVLSRQKKALQYGSNIHKLFLKLAKNKKIYTLPPRPPFVYH